MFGVSGQHLIYLVIFLAIVLIILGPGKLPDVGAGMGKAIREFRKASSEVKDSVVNATAAARDESAPTRDAADPGQVVEPPQPVAGGKTRAGG